MEKEDADNVSIKPQHGNSLAYTLDVSNEKGKTSTSA